MISCAKYCNYWFVDKLGALSSASSELMMI